MNYIYTEHDYLAHFGVKGMKWGVRKEREYRGIRSRYNARRARNVQRAIDSFSDPRVDKYLSKKDKRDAVAGLEGLRDKYKSRADKYNKPALSNGEQHKRLKRIALGTAAALAIVGGTYATYKISKINYSAQVNLGREYINKARSAGIQAHQLGVANDPEAQRYIKNLSNAYLEKGRSLNAGAQKTMYYRMFAR